MDFNLMSAFSGTGTVDYIIWTIVALVSTFAIIGIFYLMKYFMSFNIKVEIATKTSGPDLIIKDLAREIKKDGKTSWQFLKYKGTNKKPYITVPPNSRYIDILKRGKLFCRFTIHGNDLIPIHPNVKDPDPETLKESTVSPEMRKSIINDIHDSEDKYQTNSLGKMIEKFMPVITIIILTIMLMIAMDSFQKGHLEVEEMNKQTAQVYSNSVDKLSDLFEKIIVYDQTGQLPKKELPPE